MKIKKIKIYQVDLPMKEGSYSWAKQSFSSFDSTVVTIETDEGIKGVGETCPLGPSYLPAYAEGARTGIKKIGPGLIGLDPTELHLINYRMDELLNGHPYVKSALDMACWDILGKVTKLPVYKLLGGLINKKVKLFKVISRRDPDEMAKNILSYQKQGFKQFQMKVGENVSKDIERIHKVHEKIQSGNILNADANAGWLQHEALRVVKATKNIDYYIEQPCKTFQECLTIRQHTDHPFILDECMDSFNILIHGYNENAMDVVNLKINRIGGLTKAKQFRDLCVNLGLHMTIEDSWGGEITTASIAHLAHSTPKEFHFQSSAFQEYTDVNIAKSDLKIMDGFMQASELPGLGVEPNYEVLGNAVEEIC